MSHDCTRAIIDLDAVSSNFDAVCRKAKVPVMAVIKADAYGHGAVPVAKKLEALGADYLAVACLEEEPNTCPRAASCATLPVWAGLYKAINTYLDSITLQDLLEQEHKNDDYSYVI